MLIEECQIDFDLLQYKCENCGQYFYCYVMNNVCPHCEHVNSEKTMDKGLLVTDVIIIDLNRKTMEFDVYQ